MTAEEARIKTIRNIENSLKEEIDAIEKLIEKAVQEERFWLYHPVKIGDRTRIEYVFKDKGFKVEVLPTSQYNKLIEICISWQ